MQSVGAAEPALFGVRRPRASGASGDGWLDALHFWSNEHL